MPLLLTDEHMNPRCPTKPGDVKSLGAKKIPAVPNYVGLGSISFNDC